MEQGGRIARGQRQSLPLGFATLIADLGRQRRPLGLVTGLQGQHQIHPVHRGLGPGVHCPCAGPHTGLTQLEAGRSPLRRQRGRVGQERGLDLRIRSQDARRIEERQRDQGLLPPRSRSQRDQGKQTDEVAVPGAGGKVVGFQPVGGLQDGCPGRSMAEPAVWVRLRELVPFLPGALHELDSHGIIVSDAPSSAEGSNPAHPGFLASTRHDRTSSAQAGLDPGRWVFLPRLFVETSDGLRGSFV